VDPILLAAARAFAAKVKANFDTPVRAQPEDQLKGPVVELIQGCGGLFGRNVEARTEAHVEGLGGRPDIGVAIDRLLSGYVELKAPGKGARAERLTGADHEQWLKFQRIPNLIYTDASEWSLYRTGALVQRFTLANRLMQDGAKAITPQSAEQLESMLLSFMSWNPIVPTSPKALAEVLAPLCHLVRQDVLAALLRPESALEQLAHDWRMFLFPDADDAQFADAYAQTVTYALLLARFSGSAELGTEAAAKTLSRGHLLLSQALRILTDEQARREIEVGVSLLERAIAAVDLKALTSRNPDPWLYFYEDFLAAYDPRLRKDRGVYYTPVEVVRAQVRLVAELLDSRFGKTLTFADEGVVLLDPAVGTGTYPLTAIAEALVRVEQRFGTGALPGRATGLAANTHAFEILIGPYAVAHLRLTQQVIAAGGQLPPDGAHVYLTDTLESPFASPPGQMTLLHKPLSDEHRRAQKVKSETRVLVCIGNPPYDRQVIEPGDLATDRKGGWVRFGDPKERAILEDFLEPARAAGAGGHLKNLYNDYVYFWRWALWKVFESTEGPGIVSYITASSYLRGPGFVGMREWMRRTFDELWIIDLGGDNLGARKTENVFAIQTPVAIAIGVRYGEPKPETPAAIHYARIDGHRDEKLAALDAIRQSSDIAWSDCPDGWQAPFLPRTAGDYWSWPLLTDLFPWQHSGVQLKRTWPIGETPEVLHRRWSRLVALPALDRPAAMRQTDARLVSQRGANLVTGAILQRIRDAKAGSASVEPVRYGYRSLDRQWVLPDYRIIDRPRPPLWWSLGPRQIFMTSLLTGVLGLGPAAMVTADVPDLHHFRGSFGGKDVIPLWRNSAADEPNITEGLLDVICQELGQPVSPEDLLAYTYAVLSSPRYVERFSEELTTPGPRLPLAREWALFDEAVRIGRKLVWLHTYGTTFVPDGARSRNVPQGTSRALVAIPDTAAEYPERFSYDEASQTIHVGTGSFAPVAPELWSFSVSGYEVVRSWLANRMKGGAGRHSSPLDDIRPERWTPAFTAEFLELLWVLEATVATYPALDSLLGRIIAGEYFMAAELPTPTEAERAAPSEPEAPEGLPTLGLQ
jgi:hypothetical protein